MFVADLLRHGELKGGVKYRGKVEEDLTPHGQQQMDSVWKNIRNNVDIIITSPLSRCASIARVWAGQQGIPCIIDDRIAEMNYGAWEGLTHGEIEEEYPEMLAQWRQDPTGMRPPYGESSEDLQVRITRFWQDVSEQYRGKHALIVAHSGSLRMLIAHIQMMPIAYTRKIEMPYACWSRAECDHDESKMIFVNE